jgi:hypothetical protein
MTDNQPTLVLKSWSGQKSFSSTTLTAHGSKLNFWNCSESGIEYNTMHCTVEWCTEYLITNLPEPGHLAVPSLGFATYETCLNGSELIRNGTGNG